MLRRCVLLRAVAAASSTATGATSNNSSSNNNSENKNNSSNTSKNTNTTTTTNNNTTTTPTNYGALVGRYVEWLQDQRVDLSKVDVTRIDPITGRGLYAKQRVLSGEMLVSVPMHNLIMNASSLLAHSAAVRHTCPPQLDVVRRTMMSRGIRDPTLYHLMHLSLLVAAERNDINSFFAPYFDILPHPAINDETVMNVYKEVLEAPAIIEWGEYRQEYGTICTKLAQGWPQCPHVLLVHWAWRTILSRQHLLPDKGLTPQTVGHSTLNYAAYNAYNEIQKTGWSGWGKSLLKKMTSMLPESIRYGAEDHSDEYTLVPTLVPIIDQLGHLATGNVSVEVVPRDGVGSCVELQATREILPGDEVGLRFSRAHPAPFTLYRFGFLPV